jgi:predicted  nucleic acid-binding Zn-ribbon protein
MAAERALPLSGHGCPECGQRFFMAHPRQLFCKPIHKNAWETRARKRGLQFLPLGLVARETRNGTRGDIDTGKRATRDADFLRIQWRDEDKQAGRMSAVEFQRLRQRMGYDRP